MRGVTESMAGRAAIFQLLPFSMEESSRVSVFYGGFPEVLAAPSASQIWFRSYIQTYLERDVRAVSSIRDLSVFRRFMALLASRCGQMLNKTDIAAPLGVSVPTVTQWLSILEVTGQKAALLEADESKTFHPLPIPPEVEKINRLISSNMEPALTSAVYMGGSGGSSRSGVTDYPITLTQAVHKGEIKLSVGGVPAYVMPGGGINFLVDVGAMCWRPFSWTPSPAVVAPLEYTMLSETYDRLGGPGQNLVIGQDIQCCIACSGDHGEVVIIGHQLLSTVDHLDGDLASGTSLAASRDLVGEAFCVGEIRRTGIGLVDQIVVWTISAQGDRSAGTSCGNAENGQVSA